MVSKGQLSSSIRFNYYWEKCKKICFFSARMGRGTVDDEQDDPNGGGHGLEADSEVQHNYIQSCHQN